MPFTKVAKLSDVPPGTMCAVGPLKAYLAIANVDGQLYCFESLCTHGQAWLHDGFLDGYEVTCPAHYGAFDIRTGDATQPPAWVPIRTHEVRVSGEDIEVDFDEPPFSQQSL